MRTKIRWIARRQAAFFFILELIRQAVKEARFHESLIICRWKRYTLYPLCGPAPLAGMVFAGLAFVFRSLQL